jgi:Ca2+-dependent lipid-binding protein
MGWNESSGNELGKGGGDQKTSRILKHDILVESDLNPRAVKWAKHGVTTVNTLQSCRQQIKLKDKKHIGRMTQREIGCIWESKQCVCEKRKIHEETEKVMKMKTQPWLHCRSLKCERERAELREIG